MINIISTKHKNKKSWLDNFDKKTTAKIIRMYKKGMGSSTIAKKIDTHPFYILKLLKHNNVKTRPLYYFAKWKTYSDKIIKLYEENNSMNFITRTLKLNIETVRRALQENKIPIRPNSNKFNEATKNEIINNYNRGISIQNICINYKSCRETIKKIIEDSGITIPCSKRREAYYYKFTKTQIESIINDYKNGLSLKEISSKYDIDYAIYSILTAYKIPLRPRSSKPVKKSKNRKPYDLIFTKSILNEFLDDFKNGLKVSDLVTKYNLGKATAYKIINKHAGNNLPPTFSSNKKININTKNNIFIDFENKISTAEIAKKYNIDETTVRRHLRKNGLILNPVIKNTERNNKIIDMRKSGMPVKDIANLFDLSLDTIYSIVRDAKNKVQNA